MSMLRNVHETYFFFDCKLYCKNIGNNFENFPYLFFENDLEFRTYIRIVFCLQLVWEISFFSKNFKLEK